MGGATGSSYAMGEDQNSSKLHELIGHVEVDHSPPIGIYSFDLNSKTLDLNKLVGAMNYRHISEEQKALRVEDDFTEQYFKEYENSKGRYITFKEVEKGKRTTRYTMTVIPSNSDPEMFIRRAMITGMLNGISVTPFDVGSIYLYRDMESSDLFVGLYQSAKDKKTIRNMSFPKKHKLELLDNHLSTLSAGVYRKFWDAKVK